MSFPCAVFHVHMQLNEAASQLLAACEARNEYMCQQMAIHPGGLSLLTSGRVLATRQLSWYVHSTHSMGPQLLTDIKRQLFGSLQRAKVVESPIQLSCTLIHVDEL